MAPAPCLGEDGDIGLGGGVAEVAAEPARVGAVEQPATEAAFLLEDNVGLADGGNVEPDPGEDAEGFGGLQESFRQRDVVVDAVEGQGAVDDALAGVAIEGQTPKEGAIVAEAAGVVGEVAGGFIEFQVAGECCFAVEFLDLRGAEGAVIDTQVVDGAFPEKVERFVGADAEGCGLCFGCDRA